MHTGMSKATKPCGELICTAYQLCMPHDLQCYPCDSYCDKNSHNFDKYYCETQCKDNINHKFSVGDDFMFSTFGSPTALTWILFFVFFGFIILMVKQFMQKRYENPEVMIEDAIVKVSSDQTVTSVFKKKNERD